MPDEDRLAELEALREYLTAAVAALDTAAASVAAAPARLRKLMEARDKKATLLDMAGAGEIDRALIDLMDQNIAGAAAAKQVGWAPGGVLLGVGRRWHPPSPPAEVAGPALLLLWLHAAVGWHFWLAPTLP